MTRADALAMILKLEAMTVERGATPAEAMTAAAHIRRLVRQFGLRQRELGGAAPDGRIRSRAPGVHVTIVRRRAFATAG